MRFWGNGHREEPTLVLSGGGAMGALQVGVLRVLMRNGLQPSRIVGSSVGALNGAFLAYYPGAAGVERLAEIWLSLEKDRYLRFNPMSLAYRLASRQIALFGNHFLRRLIAEHTMVDDFATAKIPLYVVATNLNTGRKHVFHTGRVSDAVLASTAIPGVFSPVVIDGQSYMDAGILANLDLETAVELGSREILAIDLSHCFELPAPSSMVGVLTRTVDIVMRERVQRDMERLARRANITLIQPEIDRGPGVGDLSQVSRLIAQGEAFAEETLKHYFDRKGNLRPGTVSARLVMQT